MDVKHGGCKPALVNLVLIIGASHVNHICSLTEVEQEVFDKQYLKLSEMFSGCRCGVSKPCGQN